MFIEFHLPVRDEVDSIYLKLTDGNQTFHIATPLKIDPENWDAVKQRPLNIHLKRSKNLSSQLDFIKIKLTEFLSKKKQVSQETLSRKVKEICLQPIKFPENSFLYFMERYISEKKLFLEKNTYKRYQVFFRLMCRFEGHACKRLYPDELNTSFTESFLKFCKSEEYNESTAYRTLHFVRTILRYIESNGIRTSLHELQLPKLNQKRNLTTLNEEELESIRSAKVPEELCAARDWLLISCYMGQRVSNFMQYNKRNLTSVKGKVYIEYVQQKTGKEMLLPLHPVVREIIGEDNKFPKKIAPKQYNEQIRQIAKLSGVDIALTE